MIELEVGRLTQALGSIATFGQLMRNYPERASFNVRLREWQALKGHVETIIKITLDLDLPVTHDHASALLVEMERVPVQAGFAIMSEPAVQVRVLDRPLIDAGLHRVQDTLHAETRARRALMLPAFSAALWAKTEPFGQDVADAFPSAAEDIAEAAKCLAVERSTAAVLHLMRALELCIGVMEADLQVVPKNDNWEPRLNDIASKTNKMDETSRGPSWRDDKQFYSEAAAHFRLIKNAWRNYAMHGRDMYTQEKAKAIFEGQREFMSHLATRLRE